MVPEEPEWPSRTYQESVDERFAAGLVSDLAEADTLATLNSFSNLRFGAALRELRISNGLSLSQFSDAINYSKSHLSRIEAGQRRPNLLVAVKCDEILNSDGVLTGLVKKGTQQVRSGPVMTNSGRVQSA